MSLPIVYPLINGHRYSFASIEAIFKALPIIGFKSINYDDSLEPGEVYGSRPQLLGATRGKQKASGDFEMYRLEFEFFKATLGVAGVGYGEEYFDINVTFSEGALQPVITDTLLGCRIKKAASGNTDGTDASMIKCDLFVTRVLLGKVPIATPSLPIGI